jgi:hypothetical protein
MQNSAIHSITIMDRGLQRLIKHFLKILAARPKLLSIFTLAFFFSISFSVFSEDEIYLDSQTEGFVSFNRLSEAVRFIADCLENDEYEKLYHNCVEKGQFPDEYTFFCFAMDKLKLIHEQTPLEILYAAEELPENSSKFKLGGHDSELDHIHIDFIKREGVWYIASIWQCR